MRLAAFASGCLVAALGGDVALAESQAEIAAKLNDEGKAHMYAKQYAEASEKFRQAVARVPEPKYFYNLCTSRFQEGKFGEALTACNAVGDNNASPELKAKADALALKVKDEAKTQGIDLQPAGGGASPGDICTTNPQDPSCVQQPPSQICTTNPQDPSCQAAQNPGGMAPAQPAAVGRPPSVDLLAGTKPDNKYTWTLGADLFGGGGQIGQADYYGTASGGLRIKSDYLLNPAARLGAQGYIQITHLGAGDMDSFDASSLDIIDLGVALYKDFCVGEALCLSPLGGVQLALMSPASEMSSTGEQVFNYSAFGIRLEIAAKFAFGRRLEHVLALGLGTNGYTRVLSGSSESGYTAADLGLDTGGFAGYLGIGYTYRFNTPLGSSPFVTLQ